MEREFRTRIESGRFDEVEELWLTALEREPVDLDDLTAGARALVGAGEAARAATLLELLDEHLAACEHRRERLELRRRAGPLFVPAETLHPGIVEILEQIYEGSPSFGGLAEHVGLHRAPGDLPKTWDKIDRLEALLAYEVGTVVWMEGKGLGRVVEVNLGLESFKLEMESSAELRVGFSAAPKLLRALPPDHFLRRKLEAPQSLAGLEPGEMLSQLFRSEGRPLTVGEIRQAVRGPVPESDWSSWWAAARKLPQLVQTGRGGRDYLWTDDASQARDEILRAFAAADLRGKLDLYRRSRARDDEALAGELAEELLRLGAEAAADAPQHALAVAWALERAGALPDGLSWSLEALLGEGARPPGRWLPEVADRALRREALARVRALRADWPEVLRAALDRETDPAILEWLLDELRRGAPDEAGHFLERLLARPSRQPAAFVWLAERAGDDPGLARRNPLTLLRQILAAHHDAAFRSFRARLDKLLVEPRGVPALLARLSSEQAPAAIEALRVAPLDESFRRPLVEAVTLRHPELFEGRSEALYATRESIEAKKAELRELLEREIPRNRKAIETAREMGDLRENFEYKAARQRHELLTARAEALDRDLRRARPIDRSAADGGEVRIGSRIELAAEGGEGRTLTLLGPWESRPEEGVVSYDSDLGRSLLGLKAGDPIELEGRTYRVTAVEPYGSGGGASSTTSPP